MKISKARVKQIINEEMDGMLSSPQSEISEIEIVLQQIEAGLTAIADKARSAAENAQDSIEQERFSKIAGGLESMINILMSIQ